MTNVIKASLFPFDFRTAIEVPHGLTVAEIVRFAVPLSAGFASSRVWLATDLGVSPVPFASWHLCRPKPHAKIVIRLIPEGENLKGILTLLVAVAATAFAGPLAGGIPGLIEGSQLFGFVKAGIALGLSAVGEPQRNALEPFGPAVVDRRAAMKLARKQAAA